MGVPYTIWAKPPGYANYQRVDPRTIVGIQHEHGPMGPERLSFGALRETRIVHPDLLPFTRFYCELAGAPVWAGYGLQAPPARGEDQRFAVNAAGMAAYLAEQVIDKTFIDTDLSSWQNTRARIDSNLSLFMGDAQADGNGITFPLPKGTIMDSGKFISATRDLGPNNSLRRAIATFKSASNTINAQYHVFLRASNSADQSAAGLGDAFLTAPTGADQVLRLTPTGPCRYLHAFVWYAGAAVGSPGLGQDWTVRFSDIKLFADTAYESGDVSALKASTAIQALLGLAPLIGSDYSQLAATTFNIPHLAHKGEIAAGIDKANVYHAWQFFLECLHGGDVRGVYRAEPTTPKWVISRADGHRVQLSSSNDGSEIFNQVAVQYTDAAGVEAEEIRTASPDNTLVGRAGRTRRATLQMKAPTTQAAAQRIGDIFLSAHATTPIKGSLEATGYVRDYVSGAKVPAGWVKSNDIAYFPDEVDPDTGSIGRMGPVAGARYDHDQQQLAGEIDSRRDIVDQLVERMAVLT